MAQLESAALIILRAVEDRWPIAGTDRARVAEFLALQYMRTPAWREWYGQALERSIKALETADPPRSPEALREAAEFMATPSQRHERIVNNLAALGTLFVNMHWSLLRCGGPRLATSDQPLVPYPFLDGPPPNVSPIAPAGTLATSEWRMALSPRLLLLMTWWDNLDAEPIGKLRIEHVRNHNAIVIAQADRQWFRHPDATIERTTRPNPISFDLYAPRGYHPESVRRRVIQQNVEEISAGGEPQTGLRLIDWSSSVWGTGSPTELSGR